MLGKLREEAPVSEIWLTHGHEDHMAQMGLFPGVPFRVPEADAHALSSLEAYLDFYGYKEEVMRTWLEGMLNGVFNFEPRTPASTFSGREKINLGHLSVEVISTPGHTAGHVAFFFPEPSVLITGDYTLNSFGPVYAHRDSSIEDTIASIGVLSEIPAEVVLTGHGEGVFTGNGPALWKKYLGIIFEREEKILACLDEARTVEEIARRWPVAGKPAGPKDIFLIGEVLVVRRHLKRLLANGVVEENEGRYGLV